MRRKQRILIALVAAALAAAVIVWLTVRQPTGPRAQAPAAAEPVPTTAPIAEPAIDRAPEQREQTSRARPYRLAPAHVVTDPALATGAFSGRIVNWGSGRGVPDAELVLARGDAAATIRSGKDGRFEFVPSAPGSWRLAVVTADGFLPYAPEWGDSPIELIARAGRRVEDIVVYLVPALVYHGRVIDAGGSPVAGAVVRLLDESGESALAPQADRFVADAKGEFAFSAPDFAVLEASHPARGRGRAVVDAAVQGSYRLEIALSPREPPSGAIAGIVVDEHGNPLGDASVVVTAVEDGRRERAGFGGGAVTDEDGRFEVDQLELAPYLIEATRNDRARASVVAEAGLRDLRIVLPAGVRLRGRVSAGGEPVPAFSVVAGERHGLIDVVKASESVFDAEGEFELTGLLPGTYWVRVTAPGLATSDAVQATASNDPHPVDIKLGKGGTLVGKVIDAESKQPLGLAKVSLEMQIGSGPSAQPLQSVVVADDDGSFELAGLPPGRASVVVGAFQHHGQIVGGLQVTEGARLGPITVELTPVAEGEQPKIELAGLGLALAAAEDGLVVNEVLAGGGGEAAGIAVGDVILAVEGAQVDKLGFEGSLQAIRGPLGSEVKITLKAKGGEVRTVIAMRKKIRA